MSSLGTLGPVLIHSQRLVTISESLLHRMMKLSSYQIKITPLVPLKVMHLFTS